MAEVIEINDLQSLGAYRMAWNALFAETPRATFFQTYDWLCIYWQHFGEDKKLRVLVVRAGGQVIGIVPLCVQRQRHTVGTVRTLCYPLDNWGSVFGPIGANPAATLAMAMKHIAQTPRDWDRIELQWVAHESTDRGRSQRAMQLAGLRPALEPGDASSLIDLPGDYEDYLESRSTKFRHELRRHVSRVAELPAARHLRHRPAPAAGGDGSPNWDLFERCQEIARHSWQANSTDGNTLCHTAYEDYFRDTHAAAARLGMLDMNLLFVGDLAVAFNYNYVCRGRVLGLRMGYNPESAPKGAGMALLGMLIRDSCDRGDAQIDLGPGSQAFKRRLRTAVRTTHTLTYSSPASWRSQAIRLGHWIRRERRSA
ncbi:hypothetical protein Pla123a_12660 [Posidoniimonas polymericola]|uniref:BioF2-like acetyltransferase domain-containing protein n=1 Tax=Posidoniimonas polymericola TaxID=2528002 RepID=A0A5C5YTY3_9BACT|nr:GNAT family N-acetyltransferase [Posidoniimonas polymericola]TWT78474.1 hypothetical protein Pla123a_12660 [Posidoniimonas polymericola]